MQPKPSAGTAGPFFPSLRVSIVLLSTSSFAQPVSRSQEIPIESSFRARRIRLPVITPLHQRGQGHQYRLSAAGRLQAEQRAAIIDEIELDIAAAAISLEVSLTLAVRKIFPALDDGKISREKMVADGASELETRIETSLVQIIEENPSDAARLAAVLEIEVLIAPAFEAGIAIGAESLERLPARGVKVARVLLEPVVGGHVHAAAEPPDRLALRLGRDQEPHVHVNGRDKGIARMQYQRHAGGLECAAGQLGPCGARGGREPLSVHPGEIHSAALEHAPVLEDAALAAALVPLPEIAAEAASFDALQLRDEAVLQLEEVSVDRSRVHRTVSQVRAFAGQRRGARCRADTACRRNGYLPRLRRPDAAPS